MPKFASTLKELVTDITFAFTGSEFVVSLCMVRRGGRSAALVARHKHNEGEKVVLGENKRCVCQKAPERIVTRIKVFGFWEIP